MKYILGLDIGTLYSSISVSVDNKPTLIPNSEGDLLTPSLISYNKDQQLLVGEPAKIQFLINPNQTYTLIDNKNPLVLKELINKLIKDASIKLNTEIKDIIICVPADFDYSLCDYIREVTHQLGINIIRFISKTHAIGLSYSADHNDEIIMIVHLDETYYEVSVLEIEKDSIEVLGYYKSDLKGMDFNIAIADYLIDCFKKEYNEDLIKDPCAVNRMYDAISKAKKELCSSTSARILIPFIMTNKYGPLNLDVELTRTKYNQLCRHLINQLETPLHNALNDARLLPSELDRILLIGENTRLTSVQDKIKEITGVTPALCMNMYEYFSLGAITALNKEIKDSETQ